MGKELSMARSEEEGQPVLLAITGSGKHITASCNRNQRTQEPNTPEVSKGRAAKDTKTKSKGSRKTEGPDTSPSKSTRRGRDYQNRKSNRGDEGEHKSARRSAQELGITHPSSFCDESEKLPHHWTDIDKVGGGVLMQCASCRKHLWLPMAYESAIRLGSLMNRYGREEGYCRYLNRHRAAKVLMAKLQDLRRLEAEITDKRKFARLADKIMSDREYDRKEE